MWSTKLKPLCEVRRRILSRVRYFSRDAWQASLSIKEVHQQRQKAEIRPTAGKAQKKFSLEKKLVLQRKKEKVEVKIEGLKREARRGGLVRPV